MYHSKRTRSGGYALYREDIAGEDALDLPAPGSLVRDLRTPMLLIQTAADLLERSRDDSSLVARLQAVITRQAERISRVVSDRIPDDSTLSLDYSGDRATAESNGAVDKSGNGSVVKLERSAERKVSVALPD
jgi:signal transduction histidine kinase